MSDNEWNRKIQELATRLARYHALRDGTLRMRRVKVKSYRVSSYTVGAHTRLIAMGPTR